MDVECPHIFFRSHRGTPYVFDPSSGAIVRLKPSHGDGSQQFLSETESVPDSHVRSLVNAGYLRSSLPPIKTPIEGIEVEGSKLSISQFADQYRRKISLEVTQKCNLRCEYCCYGDCYPQARSYGGKTMSFSVARMVIDDTLSKKCEGVSIGFYGGEPLLEFHLINKIVEYANEKASAKGIDISYTISTNGTLLTDDIIHFFVAHNVSVSISIDGPRETHDRNRVFKNSNNLRGSYGSFEVVQQKIHRFIDLYPLYSKRGLLVTITAETDLRECDQFFAQYAGTFGSIMVNYVRPTFFGSHKHEHFCVRTYNNEICSSDCMAYPKFDAWDQKVEMAHDLCMTDFFQELIVNSSCQKKHPLLFSLLIQKLKDIHTRSLIRDKMPIRCVPGAFALFCSADGSYYPCEKVSHYDPFCIGNVWDGFDANRAEQLFRNLYCAGKCDPCPALRVCGLCLMTFQDYQSVNSEGLFIFPESVCKMSVQNLEKNLITYTSIMEEKPQIFFELDSNPDDEVKWLKSLRLILRD